MIGKQINFYLTASDQFHLLESIRKNEGCALIKRTDELPYHISSALEKEDGDWAVAYLCEPSRSKDVMDAISGGRVDSSELLAIEFIQPMDGDEGIQRGRFWYSTKRLSNGELIEKPDWFLNWAQSVLSRTRKELVRNKNGDWIGEGARSRLDLNT